MDKTLEAENITLLKHLLGIELRRICKDNNLDLAFFMGVDGRTFSSHIPEQLTPMQFYLMNLMKNNLKHICGQLQSQNMNYRFCHNRFSGFKTYSGGQSH
jgi:hypothetical protein